ncbi:MAG: hypothetical protein LBU65_15165 [Planctomycetaceae bacterium]|jgi:hypothetical protein|nr:hypothetical protein [Planctomycetaceae bacterium]
MSNPSINNNTIPPVSDALVKNQGGLLPFSVFFIVLFILAVGAGVGAYFFLAGSTLVKAVEEGLNNNEKAFAKDSMKIVRLSVKWTDKTADTASGEFTVNAKTTENLYKYIDNDAALKKLGITELYSAEYNTARQKFSDLPDKYQKNVTGGTSEDTDISLLRFYEIFVPEGDSIIRTGIAELKKESGSWLVSDFKVYPYQFGEEKFKDDFLPESKIPQGKRYKLDDPETKITVNNIIQKRKDFAAQVDDEYKQYEIDKRD